jgi:hypothetical protein
VRKPAKPKPPVIAAEEPSPKPRPRKKKPGAETWDF